MSGMSAGGAQAAAGGVAEQRHGCAFGYFSASRFVVGVVEKVGD
jgi:hypothetical protein